MSKQVIGKAVKPPKGWVFTDGILQPIRDTYTPEAFDALYAWAKEREYGLTPGDTAVTVDRRYGYGAHWRFTVRTDSWDTTLKFLGDGTWQPYPNKPEKRVSLGHIYHTSPGGKLYTNSCAWCARTGLATWIIEGQRFCVYCSDACTSCNNRSRNTGDVLAKELVGKCDSCAPRFRCNFCNCVHPKDTGVKIERYTACQKCAEIRTCQVCNSMNAVKPQKHAGKLMCGNCYGDVLDKERLPLEKFTEKELPVGGSMKLEALPNRPVRVISIETEVDGDPTVLANTLYNEGLVREAFVENYGTACPDADSWPAFLKYDGSVTGGELINFMLQMDKTEHADSLCNVLAKLRSLEHSKKIAYNSNCGGHIHIDAHNFSSDNVWRLLTVYNYLEDVIFRLAGAGHSYGHRTLDPRHDRANHGHGYSHPTAKGPWGIRTGAYNAIQYQDRMTGLNFKPYLSAVNHCRCGAGVDNLRSCKCVLPKCTIEWRVWNSQGNPRILHGWLAFMQALHAWADTPKEMTDEEEKAFPPFAWTLKKWSNTTPEHQKIAHERVEWIFKHLVFTDAEKDSLTFAFQQTDMTFPVGFWKRIAEIPSPNNRTVKKPRHCSIRPVPIAISKPERKVFGDARHDPDYMAARRPRFNDAVNNANMFVQAAGRIR